MGPEELKEVLANEFPSKDEYPRQCKAVQDQMQKRDQGSCYRVQCSTSGNCYPHPTGRGNCYRCTRRACRWDRLQPNAILIGGGSHIIKREEEVDGHHGVMEAE